MKKVINLLVITTLLFCVSCSLRMSSQELSEEVKKGINEYFATQEFDLKATSLSLIQEAGNNYSGIVTIVDDSGDSEQFDVKVVYDGENVKWEIPNFYQQLIMKGLLQGLMEEYDE